MKPYGELYFNSQTAALTWVEYTFSVFHVEQNKPRYRTCSEVRTPTNNEGFSNAWLFAAVSNSLCWFGVPQENDKRRRRFFKENEPTKW